MNRINKLLACSALTVCAIAAPAFADTVTVDFSGHGTGGAIGSTYSPLGLTFTDAYFFGCGGGCPLPNVNGFFAYNSGSAFTALFSTAQTRVTFQGVSNTSTLAQAYNSMGTLVASVGDNEGNAVSNTTNVLSAAGIVRIVFSYNGGINGPSATNLSFNTTSAVPEPATWGLMVVGFGLAGGAIRRRVRASEVRFDATI